MSLKDLLGLGEGKRTGRDVLFTAYVLIGLVVGAVLVKTRHVGWLGFVVVVVVVVVTLTLVTERIVEARRKADPKPE